MTEKRSGGYTALIDEWIKITSTKYDDDSHFDQATDEFMRNHSKEYSYVLTLAQIASTHDGKEWEHMSRDERNSALKDAAGVYDHI